MVRDDKIYEFRGDDLSIEVALEDGEHEPYEMQPGDTLRLTVREKPVPESPAICTVRRSIRQRCIGHTKKPIFRLIRKKSLIARRAKL